MIEDIQRAIIPPHLTPSPGVGAVVGGGVYEAVITSTSRHAEVIGRPVVAIARTVSPKGGGGSVGVVAEVEAEAIRSVGSTVCFWLPDSVRVSLTERGGCQSLTVDEVDVGEVGGNIPGSIPRRVPD